MSPPDEPAPEHQEGDAADAIRNAEVALAHQNSTTAQVDLQVVTAVLNAHQKAEAGNQALNRLQRDIEGAVATRSDLDTPAGARDFQRYLIGKLRDIRAVVAGASLDDTSNSALMAAWTSLYNSAQPGPDATDDQHRPAGSAAVAPAPPAMQSRSAATESGLEPNFDALPEDDLGLPPEDMPSHVASSPAPPAAGIPGIPSFGGGGVPGGSGWGVPGGFALPGSDERPAPKEVDDARLASDEPEDRLVSGADDHDRAGHEPTEAVRSDDGHASQRRHADRREPSTRCRDRGRGGRYAHRGGLSAGGYDHPASGYCGQRSGGSRAARTRRYRDVHRPACACTRCKPGAGERSDPAHFHRERA